MKKSKSILIGVLLIALGVVFALNTLEIVNIDFFFDGWWTLFIIIPSIIGIFSDRDKTGAIIGLLIGIALLLSAQGIADTSTILKLLFPAILVVIGIRIIFKEIFSKKLKKFPKTDADLKEYCSTFSGQELKFDGQIFNGASLSAAFGAITCDLRNSIIEDDVFITASATFSGINILLPENVNVKVKSSCIFGGVSEKKKREPIDGAKTVYIDAETVFGGVDIK